MIIKEISTWKHLIHQLVVKNLKLRYSTKGFGYFWAFFSPLFLTAIYYFVFSMILNVRSKDVPFALYLVCGIFPWQFFQASVLQGATSLIENKNLIRESNFPHYIIPISIVLSNCIIFLPSLVLIAAVSFIVLKGLPLWVFLLPFVGVIHLVLTFGVSLFVSIICLKWRDLPHFLEVFLTFIFYWTPIVYPISLVRDSFLGAFWEFYLVNPFAGLISLYRMTLLKGFLSPVEGNHFFLLMVGSPIVFSFAIFFLAFIFYRKNRVWINDYLSY